MKIRHDDGGTVQGSFPSEFKTEMNRKAGHRAGQERGSAHQEEGQSCQADTCRCEQRRLHGRVLADVSGAAEELTEAVLHREHTHTHTRASGDTPRQTSLQASIHTLYPHTVTFNTQEAETNFSNPSGSQSLGRAPVNQPSLWKR